MPYDFIGVKPLLTTNFSRDSLVNTFSFGIFLFQATSVFLYSSIDLFKLPQFIFIVGKLCFLIGLFLWFYKNILSLQFNKCFFKGDK